MTGTRGLVVKRVRALAAFRGGAWLAAMLDADEPVYFDAAVWSCRLSRRMP